MFDNYIKRMNMCGSDIGRALKRQSDQIMNSSFKRDIDYQVAKLYDQNHNFLEDVEVKFKKRANYTISGDAVDFLIQFRPFYHPEKKFHLYDKDVDQNGVIITERLGFYIELKDDSDCTYTWLIIGKSEDNQFTTYNVLKCNYTCRWIKNGVIHEQLAVLRFANSYNSGEWNDRFVTTVQNQAGIWLPTTKTTETLNYNDRLIIADRDNEPPTFHISKVEDMYPIGVTKFTLAQEHFDPTRDNAELKIADYYSSNISPEKEESIVKRSEILLSSKTPNLILGGSTKKMTAMFYDENDNAVDVPCAWDYFGKLNELNLTKEELDVNVDVTVDDNKLAVKINKNTTTLNYIGMVITFVVNKDTEYENSMQLEVSVR